MAAIKSLRAFIVKLNLERHYLDRIGRPGFENAFDEHHAIGDDFYATAGYAWLKLKHQADGDPATFRDWICRKRAALVVDSGLSEDAVDKMTVSDFADLLGRTVNKTSNSKRNTTPGDATVKIVAALRQHHKYRDDSCGDWEPIGGNELAELAKCSTGAVSNFWKRKFKKGAGAYEDYRRACENNTINHFLSLWSGEAPTAALELIEDARHRDV